MTNYRFKKAAKKNRAKAVFFTILFHLVLLGGIAYSTGADVEVYIPDVLQEMLGMDTDGETVAQEAVRP